MDKPVQEINDVMDPARARALQVTLGQKATIGAGDALPPFYHQIYFWDPHLPQDLGRDGHPKVGGVIPDMGLPRRMWAGGRMEFHAVLRAGKPAKRLTYINKSERKTGRTGVLGFVTLRHEVWQGDTLCLTDWQDLVYREDRNPDAPKPAPPEAAKDEQVCESVGFDSTLLFRYSALTFNGHRIHYDIDYAKEIEGYAGLVVHGPLLAQHMILLADEQLGGLKRFAFRATAPLVHVEQAEVCWHPEGRVWVRGPDGRQCLTATAE
jgi:3-methylfumaryl-CoA hydratase